MPMPFFDSLTSISLFFLIVIIGLCVGSFLNVVIYRLPIMLKAEWREACAKVFDDVNLAPAKKISVSLPASHCPSCQHPLKPWHNIPLISYFCLKGKCAFCKTDIHWQYPLIEAISGVFAFFTFITFGLTPTFGFALVFCWLLIVLSAIDLKTKYLPDNLTLSLLWLGLIANYFGYFVDLHTAVLGVIFGYGVLWLFFQGFKLLTGKEGMGYGDFKLLAALGAWFGWQSLVLILMLSCIIGIISALIFYRNAKDDESKMIPFGPYLSIAGIVYLFFGTQILQWYSAWMF